MPLSHGKSKKAFVHNIKAEMHAGKPQPQALAVAYSVKRKASKKKAAGGTVESGSKDMNMAKGGMYAEGGMAYKNGSAKSQSRPMPSEVDNDHEMVSKNKGNKPPKNDQWLDQPTIAQAQQPERPGKLPIKHPKIMKGGTFTTKLRDQEDDLQGVGGVNNGPQRQPPVEYNEEGPDRQGPQVRDMQDEHSTHRKPYAKGGQIETSDEHHPLDGKYEDDLLDLPPSEDEGLMMADSEDEEGQDRQGPKVPDMEREHSNNRMPYARGGQVSPQDEMDEEHHDSIAAAIMANRDRKAMQHSDSDIDREMMMAEGGELLPKSRKSEINGMDSIYAHPEEDQADLHRNAEEDANMEDQSSFDSLRKENYSESAGLKQLDQPMDSGSHGDEREANEENEHDMISQIRQKMARKRQFGR